MWACERKLKAGGCPASLPWLELLYFLRWTGSGIVSPVLNLAPGSFVVLYLHRSIMYTGSMYDAITSPSLGAEPS